MALKPRTRRKILYITAAIMALLAIAIVVVPPMFTLNRLKPKLESAIAAQTGAITTIRGDIHFSLLGAITIVARDIVVPDGNIGAAAFRVPLSALLNPDGARLDGRISIYDANVKISRLVPVAPRYDIELHNCTVDFLGKEYRIIDGLVGGGELKATVRTSQHKYDITLNGDEFFVANKNSNLVVFGNLTPDGGARGTMALKTDNINEMFEFNEPKIPGEIDLEMKFDWDGGYGVRFSDIYANNFTGNIDLEPDGRRSIEISSPDATFDFSFLLNPTKIIHETSFNLNLRGHLKLGNREFSRLIILATGTQDGLDITKIVADDTVISGGRITATGAQDLAISTKINNHIARCIFSGTPESWTCDNFSYRGMNGIITVKGDTFDISVKSDATMPSDEELRDIIAHFGARGTVKFIFADAAGTLFIEGPAVRPEFKFARDKTLSWLRDEMTFIPEFMRNEIGDFALSGDRVTFRPHSGRWELTTQGDAFVISGRSLHDWFPKMDMRAIADDEYFISGLRRGDAISNLTIRALGHEMTGTASGKNITLHTDTINLDAFISQAFLDNYDEMEFLTDAPIMLPFGLNVGISLRADKLIYNGDEYSNFVYSLKPDTQTYSITDSARGNLLAIITKDKKEYDISIQASNFKLSGMLLSSRMPLNVSDARITGEAQIKTSGKIAHDIAYNMAGDIDAVFTDGYIYGFGVDDFYAAADSITTFNAEFAIARALDGGQSRLKEMHVTGEFAGRDFKTTAPLTISMRHADATGALEINDSAMRANFALKLRGTSPAPALISIEVLPDGARRYSLSEIMNDFDASFMREFIATHPKF